MDVSSILSSYFGGINSNYGVNSSHTAVEKRSDLMQTVDSYESTGAPQATSYYNYDRLKNAAKKNTPEMSMGVPEAPEGEGGGGKEEESEPGTETEVKIINGQAYMVITTTYEDGSTSVRNVPLGKMSNDDKEAKSSPSTNLADAVTM